MEAVTALLTAENRKISKETPIVRRLAPALASFQVFLHIATSNYQQQWGNENEFLFLVKTERMVEQTKPVSAVDWIIDAIKMVFLLLELLTSQGTSTSLDDTKPVWSSAG